MPVAKAVSTHAAGSRWGPRYYSHHRKRSFVGRSSSVGLPHVHRHGFRKEGRRVASVAPTACPSPECSCRLGDDKSNRCTPGRRETGEGAGAQMKPFIIGEGGGGWLLR